MAVYSWPPSYSLLFLLAAVPQPSTAESLNSLELSPDNKKMNSRVPVVTKEPPRRRRINVPKKVVGQIETILRAFPAGIWISRFPIEFKVRERERERWGGGV